MLCATFDIACTNSTTRNPMLNLRAGSSRKLVDEGGREVSRSRLHGSRGGVAYLAFMAITIPWQGWREVEILSKSMWRLCMV